MPLPAEWWPTSAYYGPCGALLDRRHHDPARVGLTTERGLPIVMGQWAPRWRMLLPQPPYKEVGRA